jgi:Tfp pilus assembly protein PilN
MIQFNLLPDVKMQYLKAKRAKRLVIAASSLVSIAAFVIFILLLLFVDVAQKKQLNDLSNNITTNTSELSSNTNLNKILTVQSQLTTLPQLESQTPAASRLFGYLTELTPSSASISTLNVNFAQNSFSITGSADSLNTVNEFVDAIKFTTYKVAGSNQTGDAFSTVVLSSFGYSNNTNIDSTQPASYTVTFNYNPIIFNNADNVTLTVPAEVTTRSVIAQPTNLFVKSTTTSTTTGGGQ